MQIKKMNTLFSKSPWNNDEDNTDNIFNIRRNKPNLKNFNFKFTDKTFLIVIVALIAMWVLSGFYRVEEGEEVAVIRFGKFVRKGMPGLNYRLPAPFEVELKEKVTKSRRIEIGYRSSGSGRARNENVRFISAENTMLTGDENIVKLTADITWHIKNLEQYLFVAMNPEETVKAVAESAIREEVGGRPIASILSDQKQEIADGISQSLQRILDQYELGVNIEQVQLLEAEPPAEVIAAYRDVQTAKADKEREINQADAYKNDVLPRARGEAAKILQEAEGYKQSVIARSEGDTKRFISLYKEYSTNTQLTKDRLYIETIEEVLSNINKIVIGVETVLPHMPLLPR